MKDLSGKVKNEITGSEIILRGIDEGVSTLTLISENHILSSAATVILYDILV